LAKWLDFMRGNVLVLGVLFIAYVKEPEKAEI